MSFVLLRDSLSSAGDFHFTSDLLGCREVESISERNLGEVGAPCHSCIYISNFLNLFMLPCIIKHGGRGGNVKGTR